MFALFAAPATAEETVYAGRYVWGHEVNTICLCGTETCYWVRPAPEIRDRLIGFVAENTDKPYEAVYAELGGGRPEPAREGFAADYDGVVAVTRLIRLERWSPDHCAASADAGPR